MEGFPVTIFAIEDRPIFMAVLMRKPGEFPHYNSIVDVFQDDGFGNMIEVSTPETGDQVCYNFLSP